MAREMGLATWLANVVGMVMVVGIHMAVVGVSVHVVMKVGVDAEVDVGVGFNVGEVGKVAVVLEVYIHGRR